MFDHEESVLPGPQFIHRLHLQLMGRGFEKYDIILNDNMIVGSGITSFAKIFSTSLIGFHFQIAHHKIMINYPLNNLIFFQNPNRQSTHFVQCNNETQNFVPHTHLEILLFTQNIDFTFFMKVFIYCLPSFHKTFPAFSLIINQ